ncbi:MAG TPA: hypothetical protein VH143_34455 [Kofleriaceae bacterium]|jgi:hypothetical protein|nr:hypothetical protein [Kofleriaceae bacterium]
MDFEWLETSPHPKHGAKARAHHAAAELADRAGTLYRLGFSQAAAVARLTARIAWEFDPPSKQGSHKRPASLDDAAIAKLVTETYARRPKGE